MKISHSAMPRNRSSRSSRSPPAAIAIAGVSATGAVAAAARALASAAPASGGPAIRSAIDVIWHRLGGRPYAPARPEDDIGRYYRPRRGKQDTRQEPRGCALGRNYVETTMNVNAGNARRWRRGDWFGLSSWI